PKTLSVAVDWVLPQTVVSDLVFELWYSKTNNLQTATKLASLAYPQNSYTLTGVGVADVYYFWVRIRDIAGNTGEFTAAVQGRADNNPAPIVQQIQGAIGKSALSRELIDTLNRDMAAAAGLKVSAEAAERAKALQEEARARTAAIQAESSARTAELARKSSEIGTRIAATEAVNEQQAQQIQTVTSAQGNTAAGLEAEKKARTDGDRAEAQARETLAVRLGNAESGISALRETVTRQDAARSSEINTLTAKLENVEVGGRNYALSTGTAGKVLTVSGNNQTKTVTIDVSSALDLKQGDSLIISCDIELVNATSPHGKPYPRIGAEFSVIYADNSVGYFAAWYGEAVSGTSKTLKQRLVAKRTVAKEVKALRSFIVQARYQTSESIKVSNVKLERGTVATDWSPAPEDSNADTSALTALSAKVQQASSAVAELGGRVQSLYTLKTEAITGGRRAVAGVAVGVDGKTGSGEILLMADKVAYVDPKDKTVTPAFVTVIENGRAKQALNGDLFASGSVLAKHLAANLTVEAPTLNGATVNAGLINGGTIRGARIEAVDLEAANIIGDVVAVRTFELKQSSLGHQELICQIPDSRKVRRTVIVPPVFAVAENGAVVSLQLHMDGVIQQEVTIQSPEKRIEHRGKTYVWVTGPPPVFFHRREEVPISFSVPFHLPKTGSISFQKGIDGAAHSLHILCRISGNFDYSPLGDLSGIVCLIV
ncbi:TPA: DUF1983 domain-containing protein, partial [Neisseria meningitidis]